MNDASLGSVVVLARTHSFQQPSSGSWVVEMGRKMNWLSAGVVAWILCVRNRIPLGPPYQRHVELDGRGVWLVASCATAERDLRVPSPRNNFMDGFARPMVASPMWKWDASINFWWWLSWIVRRWILEFLRRLRYVVYGVKYLVISLLIIVPHDPFHREKVSHWYHDCQRLGPGYSDKPSVSRYL